ncbi:hypothetical protein J3R08_001764 [Micromonospora sp. HB375]|nr:hypothetical protein [Micromonospora sp. HB375]MDH6471272.1 hypothetical protein [Micromonospora sp. H404/HB375]ODB78249.1 hypothetical protein A8711_27525 [Micromonospora sp. II]OKJ46079.1 hypothetical protein AMK25_05945 [Micromonospora sp. TSRI0369]
MNVPIVVICLLAGRLLVPESRDPAGGRLDLGGATLSTAGLTAIVSPGSAHVPAGQVARRR